VAFIEVDLDRVLGALTMAMTGELGAEGARQYLRQLVDNDVFWEALRVAEERGLDHYAEAVGRPLINEARVNVAVSDAWKPKAD
jgi:hypothetical protein